MKLHELPTELLRLIIQQHYEPWSLRLWKISTGKDSDWNLGIGGLPPQDLLLTNKRLSWIAKEERLRSFTGILNVEEPSSDMTLLCSKLINKLLSNIDWRHGDALLNQNVRVIRFSNPDRNPAVWKFRYNFCWFSNVRRIELNCRFQSLFAVHNVPSAADFLSGSDGRLEKQMDFRLAFFLSCEKFLLECMRNKIDITVVREMGVREWGHRCLAVVRVRDGSVLKRY